jgi:hypothetical protein
MRRSIRIVPIDAMPKLKIQHGIAGESPVSAWTDDELVRLGRAEELQLASRRPDGSLRTFVTIWAVRSGDDVYVRSAYGSENPWFQRALRSGAGRISAGGVERDVAFDQAGPDTADDVSEAYHAKYDRYRGWSGPSCHRRLGGYSFDAEAGALVGLLPLARDATECVGPSRGGCPPVDKCPAAIRCSFGPLGRPAR